MVSGDRHRPRQQSKETPIQPPPAAEPEETWDEISEASWESFPASDPPAWNMRRPADPPKKPRDRH